MPKQDSLLIGASGCEISAGQPSQSSISVNEFQLHVSVRKVNFSSAEDAGGWSRPAHHGNAQIAADPFGQYRVVGPGIHQSADLTGAFGP